MNYTSPAIRDYGDLRELTAACDAAGSGDLSFKDANHTTVIGVVGSSSFCFSTPPH